MKVSFIGQPVPAYGGLFADWLNKQLSDSAIRELHIAVAWVKRSGVSKLRPALEVFRARGGTISAIIGIGEGGATRQGLQLACELFDEAFIFHDPRSYTYHPKVYLASGSETAELVIGSNNMTNGGLFSNYEAALQCHLELSKEEDQTLFSQVHGWFRILRTDVNACKLLTPDLLDILINDSRYKIGDEDHPHRDSAAGEDDTNAVTTDSPAASVFSIPTIPRAIPARPANRSNARGQRPQPAPLDVPPSTVVLQWRKQLSPTDAQQQRRTTSPSGNLRLAKAGNNIDPQRFFRKEMFGDLTWTPDSKNNLKESVDVAFDVIIDGVNYGPQLLRIDHVASREAGQLNIPTWLHWGPFVTPILRASDYTNAWVLIEHRSDGTFRLEITRSEPTANS